MTREPTTIADDLLREVLIEALNARIDAQAARIALLEAVADAARAMPRTTPKPGGAYTKHDYRIEASHVWALDRALMALALSPERRG